MKYWIVPVLVCAGVAQAHAGGFLGGNSTFVGVNMTNPLVSAKAGVALGQNNSDNTTQNSLVNAYAVQNVAFGKPGSNLSNDSTVKQSGIANYAGVGQHIETLPPMPSVLP